MSDVALLVNSPQSSAVKAAVVDIATAIRKARRRLPPARRQTESRLWAIFATCVFGSATKYEHVIRVVDTVAAAGLDKPWRHATCLHACLRSALIDPQTGRGRIRFAERRARQLADSYAAVNAEWGSLLGMVRSDATPGELRIWLATNCPGIGFKQASLFLRDAVDAVDLAVIDRHILRYVEIQGLAAVSRGSMTNVRYTAIEELLKDHAADLGMTLVDLDRATWIVLRASSRPI